MYSVILADPPWSYNNAVGHGGNAKSSRQYNTMTPAELQALDVAGLAAPDCVLLCWATWPLLVQALDLVDAWGFEYVTGFPWIKARIVQPDFWDDLAMFAVPYGVGFWARGTSEPLLICRRGRPKPPDRGFIGLFSPNVKHSRKPDSVYDYAEAMPGPYLEMFARRRRPGWDVFGDQIPGSIEIPSSIQAQP